uniref:Uncharacterized protein n=1 Tax=Geospiza parvula TaxID=87175 RepID=A0A8C3N254_GEOPR
MAPPLLLVACAVLALLPLRPRAAPAQPAYPGDDAPVEELLRFYNDLQQYLNVRAPTTVCFSSSSPSQCIPRRDTSSIVTCSPSWRSPYRDVLPIPMRSHQGVLPCRDTIPNSMCSLS